MLGPRLFALASALMICACGKNEKTEEQAPTDVSPAKSAAGEMSYRDQIELGLVKQFNYLVIPRGAIEILPHILNYQADPKQKRFDDAYLEFLRQWQNLGVLTLTKTADKNYDLVGITVGQMFNVMPAPATTEAADKYSTPDWVGIPLARCRIRTVVKDIDYHDLRLPASDDFRLIVGTYEYSPTDFAKNHNFDETAHIYKFRALVKVNPFNHTYSFQVADWGEIPEDDWKSSNIEKFMENVSAH
jgi:hypothetical protein